MSIKDSVNSKTKNPLSDYSSNLIKKGRFFFIYDETQNWILEDKTKRGLEVKEKSNDDQKKILSEKGIIYDMDGRGHKVNVRWFYPKETFSLKDVEKDANLMEKRYLELREITCPSD
jgi:hypothetical protein